MHSNRDILYFCLLGNLAEVEKCLKEGTSADFQNSEGESPLQVSAANGFSQIVNFLINSGASVDLPNSYGWTPLMHAARHGHSTTVAVLLKKKAKVNICNKLGLSPVVAAAWSGDLKTLKLLIEAGAIMDRMSLNQNECDLSTLMAAALCGHDAIVRFLLEEGVNVDQVSQVTGLSSLMLAASEGQKETVQIIVESGGDIGKTDICGRSALDIAAACCKQEVSLYLESVTVLKHEKDDSQSTDIFQAVRSNDILRVKTALKQNPESANAVNLQDGMTPLMLASMLGYNNIVNILISSSAKLDAQNLENGWTALMYAVFHRRSQTVVVLLKKGASVDLSASNGFTALDLARHLDSPDAAVIENLTSKLLSVGLSPRKASMNSTSDTLDRRKLSGTERFFPKKSETQTGLKSWIGGVAQHLQQKINRLSPRYSERYATSDSELLDETIINDVFADPKSPLEETETLKLHPSFLVSPNMYLAKELKEHKFEAIKPPLPTLHYFNPMSISSRKRTCDKNAKPVRNSLQVPRLLKDYRRKNLLLCLEETEYKEDGTTVKSKQCTGNANTLETLNSKRNSTSLPSKLLTSGSETDAAECQVGELTALLKNESLQKYAEKFREHEVDIDTLQYLTKGDLSDIGIQSSESQKKLLDVINKLQGKE